jgi:hypothetical protein
MTSAAWEQSADSGRIPFTFRIGVTSPPQLEDRASLISAVREGLLRLNELPPRSLRTMMVTAVVSTLAGAADRLIAREILAEPGSRLEVVLPLALEDYLDEFRQSDPKREFRDLLARASSIWQNPSGISREEAYEQAGRYLVEHSDVIIAVRDGQPADGTQTASIVDYAGEHEVPLLWVNTHSKPEVVFDHAAARDKVIQDTMGELDDYNATVITGPDFRAQSREQRERIMPEPTAVRDGDGLRLTCERAADWLIPYFIRADVITSRLQSRFLLVRSAIFLMSAAAVAVVAVQVNFLSSQNWVAGLEVILLVGLVGSQRTNRWWRLHDRWITYRFLAERLRSSYFLALAGTGDQNERPAHLEYFSSSSETLIKRALAEVMERRPKIDANALDVIALREYLNQHWIGEQINYHEHMRARQHRMDVRLTRATELLFWVTLIAAILHTLGVGEHHSHVTHLAALLIVLSISVPAVGSAIHGIATQQQDRRHAERNGRMVSLLEKLQRDMSKASSLARIQELAAQTERVMREENSDWFGVVRFHDTELIP